jgi:hypothetical protein
MNNPLEILRTFDRHLTRPIEFTIFGRGALALGYQNPPVECESTMDVDGIIPVTGGEPCEEFWTAQQATNDALKDRGLYITHLFSEMDIILQPDWFTRRVQIQLGLQWLTVFRPSTLDLILTNRVLKNYDAWREKLF